MKQRKRLNPLNTEISIEEGPETDLSCSYCHDDIPENPTYIGKDLLAYHQDCAIEHIEDTQQKPSNPQNSKLENILSSVGGFIAGASSQLVFGTPEAALVMGGTYLPLVNYLKSAPREDDTKNYLKDGASVAAGAVFGAYIKSLLG